MPVSSYILYCATGMCSRVEEALRRDPRLTSGSLEGVRIPVVAETVSHEETLALDETLQQLPGVRRVVLVYHNFEDIQIPAVPPSTPPPS